MRYIVYTILKLSIVENIDVSMGGLFFFSDSFLDRQREQGERTFGRYSGSWAVERQGVTLVGFGREIWWKENKVVG